MSNPKTKTIEWPGWEKFLLIPLQKECPKSYEAIMTLMEHNPFEKGQPVPHTTWMFMAGAVQGALWSYAKEVTSDLPSKPPREYLRPGYHDDRG